jgi:hypothetical protein
MLAGAEVDTAAVTVFRLFDDFPEWTKAQRAPLSHQREIVTAYNHLRRARDVAGITRRFSHDTSTVIYRR